MNSAVNPETFALGGPGKLNGCCCACFGAPPEPINPQSIVAQGGKFVTLPDSRILEYFVYGSTNADATVLVQIAGSFGTGRIFLEGDIEEMCKKLNIKGIAITVPGFGFSTVNVGGRIIDFAEDVDQVLKAENVDNFIVEGTSYGSAFAMALAWLFGKQGRVNGMHLHVPYLPLDISQGQEPHLGKAEALETSTAELQNFSSCHNFCLASFACWFAGMCGPCCAPAIPDYPAGGKFAWNDMQRSAIHSVYGGVFNTTADRVLTNWGFDVREIQLKGPNQVLISYATDDTDSPPDHGKWLAEYFQASVNADGGLQHLTYLGRFFKGELLKQFYDMTVGQPS
jgi:pimeloyl-ACP methyl ester carboxylesterase